MVALLSFWYFMKLLKSTSSFTHTWTILFCHNCPETTENGIRTSLHSYNCICGGYTDVCICRNSVGKVPFTVVVSPTMSSIRRLPRECVTMLTTSNNDNNYRWMCRQQCFWLQRQLNERSRFAVPCRRTQRKKEEPFKYQRHGMTPLTYRLTDFGGLNSVCCMPQSMSGSINKCNSTIS